MTINEKIIKLRQLMEREKIDAYIITKTDPHQSEYSPGYWNQVEYISHFTGSAGTVVVTMREAGLWTDGRYYIQAEREMAGSEFAMQRITDPATKDFCTYAKDETPSGGTIGFYGNALSMSLANQLADMAKYKHITLKTDFDLVGEIWDSRPELSNAPVFDHDVKYCGVPRTQKIAVLRDKMKQKSADFYVISSTDDIAWLFNLRGNDLPGVSFFAAFAVIDYESAALFAHNDKMADVAELLRRDGVIVKDYGELYDYLKRYEAQKPDGNKQIALLNPEKTSYALSQALNRCEIQACTPDLTSMMKAVKNSVEFENLERANIRDGVAMVKFSKWLKENVSKRETTEYDVGLKLEELRAKGENFVEPSFTTITAYMENAAMMHYRPHKENCSVLKPEGMLLVDSGGNYYDGTTDITRTFVLSELSEEMKRDFTLVLKSHISIANAVFLYGATGSNLDTIARLPMWSNCMDYKCGTGHGIGYFLNVHEGPHILRMKPTDCVFEAGMIVTDEPGVYREGEYGIRTENTLKVVDYRENQFGRFMRFEVISYCPIDLEGVIPSMLTEDERNWLNDYHATVYEKLSPHLNDDEREWLANATREM